MVVLAGFAGTTTAADCRSSSDCVPPVTTASVDGVAGENGWWRSDVVVALVCTDNVACASTRYALDGSEFSAYAGPFEVAGDGLHHLAFYSEDKVGNAEQPVALVLKIDSAAPSVAFADLAAGDAYANNVPDPAPATLPLTLVVGPKTIAADLDDALSGAGRIEFYVDGELRGTTGAAPFTIAWDADEEAAGDHLLTLVGFDVAGNAATASMTVITVPLTQEGAEATADRGVAAAQGVIGSLPLPSL